MIELEDDGPDWEPLISHGMSFDECKARLLAANEPVLEARLKDLDSMGLNPGDLDAIKARAREEVARHIDRILPGLMLNMERSAATHDDDGRLH